MDTMRRRIGLMLTALLCLVCAAALGAGTVTLPAGLEEVEEEAFAGDTALTEVVVPEGVTSIGSRAFAETGLETITLPSTLVSVASDAFDDKELAVIAPSGSWAALYAQEQLRLKAVTYGPRSKAYTIGTDMPAGTYIITQTGTSKATVKLWDITGKLYVTDSSFAGNAILTVYEGEKLYLDACQAMADYVFAQHGELSPYATGAALRVGTDLPAGSYIIKSTSTTSGRAYIDSDTRYHNARTESGFDTVSVTVSEGQVLRLRNARIFKADGTTTYRAYLVANTYSSSSAKTLEGTPNDTKAMRGMLGTMDATPYSVTVDQDKGKSGILSGIASVFADADDDDVSLFFFSGHGSSGGKLLGNDGLSISPSELRSALDAVAGKKIVIVDACFSGAIIQKSAALMTAAATASDETGETEETEEETATQSEVSSFASSFVSGFRPRLLAKADGYLNEEPYLVLCACTGSQESWQAYFSGVAMGVLTRALTVGCGWNGVTNARLSTTKADSNGDSKITLAEAYSYSASKVQETLDEWSAYYGTTYVQTVTAYPSDSGEVLFGR